jgi:hypothetical protein
MIMFYFYTRHGTEPAGATTLLTPNERSKVGKANSKGSGSAGSGKKKFLSSEDTADELSKLGTPTRLILVIKILLYHTITNIFLTII